jgi:hypothetical protein
MFGMKDDIMASTTVEYLDLLDPNIANASFQDLKMPAEGYNLRNVMLFEDQENTDSGQEKRLFFFGGNEIQESKRIQGGNKVSKLLELVINWDKSQSRPKPTSISIRSVNDVTFNGHPNFTSQYPQKYYSKACQTWFFVDQIGTLYRYKPSTKQTSHISLTEQSAKSFEEASKNKKMPSKD